MKKLPKWLLIALPVAAVLVIGLLVILLWPKSAPLTNTPTETTPIADNTSDQLPPEFSDDDFADNEDDVLPGVVPPEWWR